MNILMCCSAQFAIGSRRLSLRLEFNKNVHDQWLAKVLLDNCLLPNRFYRDYFSQGTTTFSTDFEKVYLNGSCFSDLKGSSYRIKHINKKDLLFQLIHECEVDPIIEEYGGYKYSSYSCFFNSVIDDSTVSFSCIKKLEIISSIKIVSFAFDISDLDLVSVITL